MRIVHISDLHLGLRQYHRQTARGVNQREADIGLAFRKAIDAIIELRPDLVLVGGDVFHNVRPTNPAILHAYNQFEHLMAMLPDCIVVMVAGNHDLPRTSETGCLLWLFKSLGVHVAVDAPLRFAFRDRDLSVYAVPALMRPRPAYDPDPSARYNVLLTHDEIQGVVKRFGPLGERLTGDLTLSELGLERWDYAGLGHYHVYHRLGPNAYYSGSLEYASSNVWGEVDEEKTNKVSGKGFIFHDMSTGEHRFHRVPLARDVIDLDPLTGSGMTSEELSRAICDAVESCEGGIDDRIVRLVVRDVPRQILRDLDHRRIRDFKRRALHFHLDVRRPQVIRMQGSGAPGRRTSLAETVREMLQTRTVSPGIDRAALVDLGLQYLSEAERLAPALTGDSE